MGAKYTEAQNMATQRYQKKAYDRISVTFKKGKFGEIRAAAGKRSLNEYIREAVEEKMERERNLPEIEREKFEETP